MGTSGNRDCQWASGSVLKDFTVSALTISAGSLFQNGTARNVKPDCRRRVTLCVLDVRRRAAWEIPGDHG